MIFFGKQFDFDINNAGARMRRRLVYVARATLAIVLSVGLNMTGFGLLTETALAYYGDYELSSGNSFTASMLDFSINENVREGYIGLEADGDIDDFNSIVMQHSDSLDVQYSVQAELVDGKAGFCDTLDFQINHQGTDFSDGKITSLNLNPDHSILDVTRATTTDMGTWEFKDIDLTDEASEFAHGTVCDVDLIFSGWRDGVATPEESGYTDEERIKLRLKNRMVVMNEFLPNPDDSAHGLDYGDDHDDKPNGEWIELYNNSEVPKDVGDWLFEDEADNMAPISPGNTDPATTTIPAKGWLVVYMGQAFLNNTGDTIELKDDDGEIVDEYTYDGSDYCELEPTPTATNTTSASGDCNEVPPNKSYARIPDGVGAWVDPIPTPGAENTLEQPEGMEEVAGTSTELSTEDATSTSTSTSTTTASSTDDTATSSDETASSTEDSTGSSSGGDPDTTSSDDDGYGAGTEGGEVATSTDETASSTNATSTDETASTSSATTTASSTDDTATSSNETATSTDEDTVEEDGTSGTDGTGSTASSSDPIESEEKATSTEETSVSDETKENSENDGTDSDGGSDSDGDNDEEVTEDEQNTQETEETIESEEKTKQSEEEESDDEEADDGDDPEAESTADAEGSGESTEDSDGAGDDGSTDDPSEDEAGGGDNSDTDNE